MKLLLVQPPLTREERYGTKAGSGEMNPPLGLAYLAASARQAGHDVEILDAVVEGWDVAQAAEEMLRRAPDVVGFTAVTASVLNADAVAARLKEAAPKIVTIIGGPHLSGVPELTMRRCPHFDLGIIGEGERTLCEVLNVLKGKGIDGVKGMPGTIARCDQEFVMGPPRERIRDLDSLPRPAWDLLPDLMERYGVSAIHSTAGKRGMTLVTSRGCPGKCIFCSRGVFGNKYSAHSPRYVVDMVKYLMERYGVGQIQFDDDEFLTNRRRALEIAKLLREECPGLRWCCFARVDHVDDELLREIKSAGCWQIKFGIESGNDGMLRRIGKETTVEQIRDAVSRTARAGIAPTGHFMIGYPGETSGTAKETIKLALSLPLNEFFMTYVTPFPGTALWETALSEGRYEPAWRDHSGWKPVFVPNTISAEEMIRLRRKAYLRFYLRPRIFLSFLRRIRSFRQLLLTARGFLFMLRLMAVKSGPSAKGERP